MFAERIVKLCGSVLRVRHDFAQGLHEINAVQLLGLRLRQEECEELLDEAVALKLGCIFWVVLYDFLDPSLKDVELHCIFFVASLFSEGISINRRVLLDELDLCFEFSNDNFQELDFVLASVAVALGFVDREVSLSLNEEIT